MNQEPLLPFTIHILDGVFLEFPQRVYLHPEEIVGTWMNIYRKPQIVESNYKTECVEIEGIGVFPLVCGSNIQTIEAFTVNYENHNFGNKYFTVELFNQYLNQWVCQCDHSCIDTCFLLLNNCIALVNGEGLLI